jgi:hypothetical protein
MQKYVWDTNSLIKYYNDYHPIEVCRDKFRDYAQNGGFIMHQEVRCELTARLTEEDEDSEFVVLLDDLKCFLDNDSSYSLADQSIVKQIAAKYQNWFDNEKDSHWADPWLIAHAKNSSAIIITDESQKPERLKIPSVAKAFGVSFIKTVDFFKS